MKIISKIIAFFVGTTMSLNVWNTNTPNEGEKIIINTPQIEESIVVEDITVGGYSPQNTSTTSTTTSTSGWWKYPSEIKLTKRNGDDLLVLVNKEYRLSENYVPKDLVSASLSGIRRGGSYRVRNIIINDLKDLVNQAKKDGIDLAMRSAYRSYQDQLTTYNYWLRHNKNIADDADKVSARAGHSQHQLGTAVDFTSSEIQDGIGGQFHTTKAAKWLAENAWKYGFVISFPKGYESTTGYNYESWHYRYIGKDNAQEMINSGKILEIYLRGKN